MKLFGLVYFLFSCLLVVVNVEASTLRAGFYYGNTVPSDFEASKRCVIEVKKVDLSDWQGLRYLVSLGIQPLSSSRHDIKMSLIASIPVSLEEAMFSKPAMSFKPEEQRPVQEWQSEGGSYESRTGWNKFGVQTNISWSQTISGSSPHVQQKTLRLLNQGYDSEFVNISSLSYTVESDDRWPSDNYLAPPIQTAVTCHGFSYQ